jgi:hypothetical protein
MKHTITMQIHKCKHSSDFCLMSTDMSEYGYVLVGPTDVSFEVPDDFDPRPQQIKALEEKQRQAAAAFYALTTDIKRQISELQSLEMTA